MDTTNRPRLDEVSRLRAENERQAAEIGRLRRIILATEFAVTTIGEQRVARWRKAADEWADNPAAAERFGAKAQEAEDCATVMREAFEVIAHAHEVTRG